jgi:hypothetical protein
MKRSMFLILAILITVIGGSVFAQDSAPNEDPTENACYAGGVMSRVDGEGCATEWAWQCGWYLATWQKVGGWYPDWCESVFPSAGASSVPDGVYIGCQQIAIGYIYFGWNNFVPTPVALYDDASCTNLRVGQTVGNRIVYAYSATEAVSLCQSIFSRNNATLMGSSQTLFYCT